MQNLIDLEKKINSELTTKIKKTEINFVEHEEFRIKFPEFKKSFSSLDEKSFYFNALQFMVPRTQLLYEPHVNL